MNTYSFIYSRTFYKDYRLLTPLGDKACPKSICWSFEQKVRGLLRDGVSRNLTNEPTWLLVKEQDYLLWGFAMSNRQISEEFSSDESGTLVRCFCGVIYDNASAIKALPYSMVQFKPMFTQVMETLWKSFKESITNVKADIKSQPSDIVSGLWTNTLNIDSKLCRLFPDDKKERLIGECLAYDGKISIAINVISQAQVVDRECSLMNAVMRNGVMNTQDVAIASVLHPHDDETSDVVKEAEGNKKGIKFTCQKCGCTVDWIDAKGRCVECVKKRRKKKILLGICVCVLSAVAIIINECSQSGNSKIDKENTIEFVNPNRIDPPSRNTKSNIKYLFKVHMEEKRSSEKNMDANTLNRKEEDERF